MIIAGHMGLKNRKDDYANPVRSVTDAVEADAYIAGHTHQDMPSLTLNRTLYTQANYYGIHAGRLDLTFSRSANRLVNKRAFTVLMDSRFELDPVIIDQSRSALDASESALAAKVGALAEPLSSEQKNRTTPSLMHRFIGSGIKYALTKKGVEVDAVFHGLFSSDGLNAGDVSLHDLWKAIPYENMLVTAELNGEEIARIIEEDRNVSFSNRVIMGAAPDAGKRITVVFNSYDAQSGGRKLNILKESLQSPAAKAQFHKVESREALIVYLQDTPLLSTRNLLI